MRSISILFLIVSFFLFGCLSTFYAKTQMAVQTKEELAKIINPTLVKIERDDNYWNGAYPFVVYDGKKEIGRLGPSGAFEWRREAGYIKLTIMGGTTSSVLTGDYSFKGLTHEDYLLAGATYIFKSSLTDDAMTIVIKPQQTKAPEDIVAFGRAIAKNPTNAYATPIKPQVDSSWIDGLNRQCHYELKESGMLNIYNLANLNIEIIKEFLNAFPKGKYAQYLEEINQYYEAELRPSTKAFKDYLKKWPDGLFKKWAKDNLDFISLGEATDKFLLETQVIVGKIVQKKALSVSLNNSYLSTSSTYSDWGLMGLMTAGVIEKQGVMVKGTLSYCSDDSVYYSFYFNGSASNELTDFNSKFILRYDDVRAPLLRISLSKGSWIIMDGKHYYYNAHHWFHGLNNPLFHIVHRSWDRAKLTD